MVICALATGNIDIVILQEMKVIYDRNILGKYMYWVQQRFGFLMYLFDWVGFIFSIKLKPWFASKMIFGRSRNMRHTTGKYQGKTPVIRREIGNGKH